MRIRVRLLQKLINLRRGKGTRADDQIPLRAMGPAFFNEYEARAEYYDDWLKEQVGEARIPESPQDRHRMILELRQEAYQRLCDTVYQKKGYTPDGVPLPETLERRGVLDDQALDLLGEFGLGWKDRQVSN